MEIKKTNNKENHRVVAMIYGESGVGKTTLASTLKGKTLILSAESGLLSLKDFEIDYVELKTVDQMRSIINDLKDGLDYDNIFIDSLSEIASIFISELEKQFPDRKDALKLWGDYYKQMKSFVRTVRDMVKYNIFMTSLCKIETDDFQRRFTLPDVNGKIAHQLGGYFDEVFYYQVIEKEDETKRLLLTQASDRIIAKDRSGKLDKYEEANLQDIINKIQGA
jgi:phage nucleotide-binding protein